MISSNGTFQDLDANRTRLSNLVRRIQQLRPKVKALPDASEKLAIYCDLACDIRLGLQSSADLDKQLYNAFKRVDKVLNHLSSSFYVKAFRKSLDKDLLEAWKMVSDAVVALQQAQTPPVDAETIHPVPEKNGLQRELEQLAHTLSAAKAPQEKAYKIFDKGVTCIRPTTLDKWVTKLEVKFDSRNTRQVRFGQLYRAWLGQEMVLVKRVGEIQGSSKGDTIKRVKALSHWMMACEGLMPVQSIQFPDLIIYGSTNAIPLDVYLTTNELNAEDKWKLAFKIASAVSFVHECKIIHRDIRAANVFMVETPTGEYEPKLAGFEICRSDANHSIGPKDVYDVWHAPEIRTNHGTSPETDVFAFGVLMFEIAMGRPPQWIESTEPLTQVAERVEENVLRWVAQSALSASEQYNQLMHRCLAATKGERPTMAEVFTELSEGY